MNVVPDDEGNAVIRGGEGEGSFSVDGDPLRLCVLDLITDFPLTVVMECAEFSLN